MFFRMSRKEQSKGIMSFAVTKQFLWQRGNDFAMLYDRNYMWGSGVHLLLQYMSKRFDTCCYDKVV